jgi:DNA-binding winged helix-turn-helix (wHTH) protein
VLELVARVKALLRRTDALARNARMESGSLALGNLDIEPLAREVRVDGKLIELTPREFDLLYFFARNPGKVFSRLDLLNQVWGYQHDGYEHTVNTHINRLRTKVEADPAEPRRILTVWGRGYKLSPTGAPTKNGAAPGRSKLAPAWREGAKRCRRCGPRCRWCSRCCCWPAAAPRPGCRCDRAGCTSRRWCSASRAGSPRTSPRTPS